MRNYVVFLPWTINDKNMDRIPYQPRYPYLMVDYAFRKMFGTEEHKEYMISLLNAVLEGYETIRDLTFVKNDYPGMVRESRSSYLDVHCRNDKGQHIMVEMQNSPQTYFKDRTLYYTTFPLQEQAVKGDWDFKLNGIYTIGLLNFNFADSPDSEEYYYHEVKLLDVRTKQVFYDKLTLFYVELRKFKKTMDELETMLDKWLFLLLHIHELDERPAVFCEPVFVRFFEEVPLIDFTEEEFMAYRKDLKHLRDAVNQIQFALNKGLARGIHRGMKKGLKYGKLEGKKEGKQEGIHAQQYRKDNFQVF